MNKYATKCVKLVISKNFVFACDVVSHTCSARFKVMVFMGVCLYSLVSFFINILLHSGLIL